MPILLHLGLGRRFHTATKRGVTSGKIAPYFATTGVFLTLHTPLAPNQGIGPVLVLQTGPYLDTSFQGV